MIEYWRWWLVHLWVEGFFEVFATAVIALLFTRLGLIHAATANSAIILKPSSSCSAAFWVPASSVFHWNTDFVIAIGAMSQHWKWYLWR
jgi:nitric oxide reductase subunit B